MNRAIFNYLGIAGRIALTGAERAFALGAVGVRSDGCLVFASNLPSTHPQPAAHAEARLCKKLDSNAVVYVARVLKSGQFALSRPCARCLHTLRCKKVRRVYYTIADNEFGVLDLQ
jgi:tRNA(Arg) A34 adenosine deaminase TadA